MKIKKFVRIQNSEFEFDWNHDPILIKMLPDTSDGNFGQENLQLADWRVDPTMGITMSGSTSDVKCVDYEDEKNRVISLLLPGCKVNWRVENDMILKIYYNSHPLLSKILSPSSAVQWNCQDVIPVLPCKPDSTPNVIIKNIDYSVHDAKQIKFFDWNGTIVFIIPKKKQSIEPPPEIPTWDDD